MYYNMNRGDVFTKGRSEMPEKRVVYVMTTAVPGLIKLGSTKAENYAQTTYALERNGYRSVFGLKKKFAIEVDDGEKKEKALKALFAERRLADTDLFALDATEIVRLLASFDGEVVFPKSKTKRQTFNETEKADEEPKTFETEPKDEDFDDMTVRLFLDERTKFDETAKTTRAEIREAYERYCEERNFRVASPQRLYAVMRAERTIEMREQKYPEIKIRGERFFANVRIER